MMRTTITLDPDVQALLREASHRSGKPFKTTVNEAIRAGLQGRPRGADKPPVWPIVDLGAPLVDLNKAMALADELDDTARLDRTSTAGAKPKARSRR
jgi:hypothetical protein